MEGPKRNLESTKPQRIGDRYGVNTLNKGFYKRNGKQRRDDEQLISSVRGLFLTSALFFYWELLVAVVSGGGIGKNLVYMLLSSVFAAMLVSLVSGIFENTLINFLISYLIKAGVCVVFMAEIIVKDMTGAFFAYSTDLSEYSSSQFFTALSHVWWKLVLVAVPMIIIPVVYTLYRRIEVDILGYARRSVVNYVIVVLVAVLAYFGLMLLVDVCDSEKTPVYSVLHDRTTDFDEKAEEFGIITSVAQDVKRSLFE